MDERAKEVQYKLGLLREELQAQGAAGARLRGTDWFAWATAGGSNTVLLAAETGVAEVLITADDAYILTDEIEAQRLFDEELPSGFSLHAAPWAELSEREALVREATANGRVISDRPEGDEAPLPSALVRCKWVLEAPEQTRYRDVCKRAAAAMAEVLGAAHPEWTECELAGAGAEALWQRKLEPILTLAAGSTRLYRYRHPTPTEQALGYGAMLVFCARGHGLVANLTRFVSFAPLSQVQCALHRQVREIEQQALAACRPGRLLREAYDALSTAYAAHGYPNAIAEHHQGGLTGYQAREVIVTPACNAVLDRGMALALNPSLPGAKIEDTFLLGADGALENLTLSPEWPSETVDGRARPLPLERA